MTTLLLVLFLCVYLAAFFSGTEMAFISANKFRIREQADAGDSHARKIVKLQDHPQLFLTAILLGNNIVHVVATAVLAYGMDVYYGISSEWIVTAILSPVILVFGEMVPKDYCRLRSHQVLHKYADSLSFTVKILSIPSRWILGVIGLIMRPFGGLPRKNIFVSEEEFRSLIEESTKSGILEAHEKQIIDTILDFENIRLDTVMTPLAKASQMDIRGSVADIKNIAAKTNTKMILIYEEDPAIIMGIVYVFDVLFEEDDRKGLKDFLRSPVFLSSHLSVETAFLTLQQKRSSYAIVTNPLGEAVGIAPIERLLAV